MNFTKMLLVATVLIFIAQSCNKEDNDPINSFIRTLPAGVYSERYCTNGQEGFVFSTEDIEMIISKESSNQARIAAHLSGLGEVFSVIAEYASDTLLIIGDGVINDEVYHSGSLVHRKSTDKYIFSLIDSTQLCALPNVLYETN